MTGQELFTRTQKLKIYNYFKGLIPAEVYIQKRFFINKNIAAMMRHIMEVDFQGLSCELSEALVLELALKSFKAVFPKGFSEYLEKEEEPSEEDLFKADIRRLIEVQATQAPPEVKKLMLEEIFKSVWHYYQEARAKGVPPTRVRAALIASMSIQRGESSSPDLPPVNVQIVGEKPVISKEQLN